MKKFEEEVKRPTVSGLIPLSYKENLMKELSKAVQENYTKNAQILREYKEYIEYLEQELEKSRDLECTANNQASYEYILKCEAEELLEEKQKQIAELKSQLEKQQPEVPEFVATGINSIPRFFNVFGAIKFIEGKVKQAPEENSDWYEFYNWLFKTGDDCNVNVFASAWINGYTVAKEKRFYLKFNKQLFNPENGNTVYSDLYLDDEGALITDKNYAK